MARRTWTGRWRSRAMVSAVALTIVMVGPACARADGPDLDARVREEIRSQASTARERGWAEQADVLADGVLTDAEVDAMHSLYRECMAATDAVLSPAHRSPIDGRTWFEWEVNPEELTAADNGPTSECRARFRDLGAIDLRPKPMAEPLRRSVQSCLEKAGVEADPADRDVQQIYRRAGTSSTAVLGECINTGMREEYPEIESFSWGPPVVW